MEPKRRWQIPVLVIGILLLLFVGTKAIMDMTGGPRVAAKAKDPETRKTVSPAPETTEGGGAATPAAPTPRAPSAPISQDPEVEVAALRLAPGDPLAPLPGTQPSAVAVGPAAGGAGPTPPVPPVGESPVPVPTLIAREDTRWQLGTWTPVTAPGERQPETGVTLVGTITGARNIAVVRDPSRPAGQQLVLASEGDRIGRRGSPIQKIEPGTIRVRGQLGAINVYSAEQATGREPEAAG